MTEEIKLHLGCGDIRLDGWINVDARPGPAVDIVADIAAVSTLAWIGTVDAIYACHVLEHFGFHCVEPTAARVLKGWVNLLKPGGKIYLSVPDLQAVGRAISDSREILEQVNFMKCVFGGCEYPGNRHLIGFTRLLLEAVMREAGLSNIGGFYPFAPDTSQFVLHGCRVSLNRVGIRV